MENGSAGGSISNQSSESPNNMENEMNADANSSINDQPPAASRNTTSELTQRRSDVDNQNDGGADDSNSEQSFPAPNDTTNEGNGNNNQHPVALIPFEVRLRAALEGNPFPLEPPRAPDRLFVAGHQEPYLRPIVNEEAVVEDDFDDEMAALVPGESHSPRPDSNILDGFAMTNHMHFFSNIRTRQVIGQEILQDGPSAGPSATEERLQRVNEAVTDFEGPVAEGEECLICQQRLDDGTCPHPSTITSPNCRCTGTRLYGRPCIHSWLVESARDTCPLCRQSILGPPRGPIIEDAPSVVARRYGAEIRTWREAAANGELVEVEGNFGGGENDGADTSEEADLNNENNGNNINDQGNRNGRDELASEEPNHGGEPNNGEEPSNEDEPIDEWDLD